MDYGGTEALLMSLLRITDRSKFQYDIVEQTDKFCDHDEEILSLGCTIYRTFHISASNLKQYRAWWRQFFQEHPEYKIVHGHSRGSAPIYLDEARKAGRITIAHCHNNSHGKGLSGFVRYIWQLPLRRAADYNFACSHDSGVSQFGKNGVFRVIKNGIQTEKFSWDPQKRAEVRHALGLENNFVVGNVARFITQKNHSFLIPVFAELKKRRPDAKLMLVGEGPLQVNVKKQVEELGLQDDVLFMGIRPDVQDLMQAMDVFVLPSIFEGLGIVNIEAQAAGLPCFASDRVVPPEVKLTELMHFIPLEESPAQWAEYILSHTIPTEERRDQRRAIIDAGFDIRTTAEQLNNFYLDVLKK